MSDTSRESATDFLTLEEVEAARAFIEAELNRASPDWLAIERATRKVVAADKSKVRFSVDAAHIQRLGMELVGKQETAVSELIKNAYDADATKVSLTFLNAEAEGGTLVIEDDGVGMGDRTIRDAWMTISTSNKAEEPTSPTYGRRRAGRKGIGRFSAQRLGKRLVLETRPAGSDQGYSVTFDWDG